MYTLYGNGIHDDQPAIQEMIDSGACEVVLPAPKVCYLISKTLLIPSNFRLILPRYAEIKLADGANCLMVRNKGVMNPESRHDWVLIDKYSMAESDANTNFEICGGIWNFNNKGQNGNPMWTGVSEPDGYTGFGIFFFNVKNFRLTSMTLKDPVNFAVTLDTASWFTVEDITFDFNYGNPTAVNMDGIHLNGNCHYGTLRNLKGACYDDLVAMNADEGTNGPITNIDVDGIYSTDCHSAVRLLTYKNKVENIHIRNVFGTYYQYCIGLTQFTSNVGEGYFDGITLDNIYASKAERYSVYCKDGGYVFPFIFIQDFMLVKNLKVHTLHRREFTTPVETFYVGWKTVVENLILENIMVENNTSERMSFLVNKGEIEKLTLKDIRLDDKIILYKGDGVVDNLN